jgi:hypothetical protein
MAWTATLVNATQDGTNVTLDISISDGSESIDVSLTYSMVDPRVNLERIRTDIEHYAKGFGKWPYIQSKIGEVIHSG